MSRDDDSDSVDSTTTTSDNSDLPDLIGRHDGNGSMTSSSSGSSETTYYSCTGDTSEQSVPLVIDVYEDLEAPKR